MPHVILTKDDKCHTIFGVNDLLELAEDYAGYEVRRGLEEHMGDVEELDKQNDALSLQVEKMEDHYHRVFLDFEEKTRQLTKALNKDRLNRKELVALLDELILMIDREL